MNYKATLAPYTPSTPLSCAKITQKPVRLGAYLVGDGVDIAVYSKHAQTISVCFFDLNTMQETSYQLNADAHGIWQGHIPGITAGTAYGFRISGNWDKSRGMSFNPAKVVLDPYAKLLAQIPQLHPALYAHKVNEQLMPLAGMEPDEQNSAPVAALGMITAETPSTPNHPYVPWNKTVIYEAHVVGLTKNCPEIPAELRGTYAGIAHPYMVNYLKNLGITTLELLPIQAKFSEPFLTQKNSENYWGYNTLSYFSPEYSYATIASQNAGGQAVLAEIKTMVNTLHEAGIEVIMDVVYNHTCEGEMDGPTLSLRGIDSTRYYRHDSHNPAKFKETTGCGNALDFRRSAVVKLTLDSLRYWVTEVGIDGFRFDLATTLGRNGDNFLPKHPFYVALTTDPVLSTVKLINEPWDIGVNGWQTGNFIAPTSDWNDRFRDTMRSFWVADLPAMMSGGAGGDTHDLATRLSGSADIFSPSRDVHSSINFITAHDGFTLYDLVSYNQKHNELNGENNADGADFNRSWNHGIEGSPSTLTNPAELEQILANRERSVRNLFASLILAAGTPMLTAGDEVLKTQQGNNNSYCQNTPLSWLDWENTPAQQNLLATVSFLLQLRREHTVLRPQTFYQGTPRREDPLLDLEWFDSFGETMRDTSWFNNSVRTLQMLRSGNNQDVDALIIFNGALTTQEITLPVGRGLSYELIWSSDWEKPRPAQNGYIAGQKYPISPLSIQIYFTNNAKITVS